eukprot:7375804-Prymnesium_polylepis.2
MADFYTKPLGPKQFYPFRNRIMNYDTRYAAPAALAVAGAHGMEALHTPRSLNSQRPAPGLRI